jgi:hypothetical protein
MWIKAAIQHVGEIDPRCLNNQVKNHLAMSWVKNDVTHTLSYGELNRRRLNNVDSLYWSN